MPNCDNMRHDITNNYMKTLFNEIIPVEDRLDEELSRISGGKSTAVVICDSGVLCDSGAIEEEEEEDITQPGSKMV